MSRPDDLARQAETFDPTETEIEMTRCQAWQILCVIGLGWVLATAAIAVLVLL